MKGKTRKWSDDEKEQKIVSISILGIVQKDSDRKDDS